MRKMISLSLCALLMTSCSLVPEYQRPQVEMPAAHAWSEGNAPSNVQAASTWWASFGSTELNTLIDAALANNTDVLAGIQRIAQARATLKIAGATLLPTANGSAGASRSYTNPKQGRSTQATSLSAGVNVSYELDLFGANKANISAAQAGLDNSIYTQGALALTLMGDVATGYFTLINLSERLVIADTNLEISREVLRIIQARVDQGVESELALAQQISNVASSEATRATLYEQIQNAENALAILLGKPPQSIEITRKKLDGLHIPTIAAGQPSQLLERRPDLLASEANLIAANAAIGVARATFFPSISLGLGNSLSLAGFGDPSSSVLSLASSLSVPIFQGGRLAGGLEQATARQLELAENYRGAILSAFQDVDNAMAAVNAASSREHALQTAMTQSQKAYRLSKQRYDAGSIDFQTLLDTQKSRLTAEDSYAQARLASLTAAINLYRALGGGWV